MAASNHLETGLFTREPGTARGWVEASRGVAAAVYGPAAPAYAHDVFGQLAQLSEVSAPAADAAYPARVVEAAQVLESLHRELWQLQGGDDAECGLGAGVLVFEPERAYFLQVGGVLLYQSRGGRLTEVATAHNASPLLGAAVKSGIRVHTLSAVPEDAFVIVASNVEAPLDADAIESCLAGAGDIESAAEAMGALVDVSADGCTVVAIGVHAPVAPARPERPAAGASAGDWSFEGDVVGELSAFMEGLAEESPPAPAEAETEEEQAADAPTSTGGVLHGDDAAVHAAELHGAMSDRATRAPAARMDDADDAVDDEDEADVEAVATDTGPAFVPPAVHPMDRAAKRSPADEEEDPSLDPLLTKSSAQDESDTDAFGGSGPSRTTRRPRRTRPTRQRGPSPRVRGTRASRAGTRRPLGWSRWSESVGATTAATRRRVAVP